MSSLCIVQFRTDALGRRHSNDARKLYSDLLDAQMTRQIVEYFDDKKYDQSQAGQSKWVVGSRIPWHTHFRRAFKEKLRTFALIMQPQTVNRHVRDDPHRHKVSRLLVCEARSSFVLGLIVSRVNCFVNVLAACSVCMCPCVHAVF